MFTPDEVAGVVDLFGALSPDATATALSELAYRRGEEPPEGVIEDALAEFALVEFEHDGDRVLGPGPAAFPTLPEGAADLPHILEEKRRPVERNAIERAAVSRLRSEAEDPASLSGDRAATLVEISYDIEAWGGRDLSDVRTRLRERTGDAEP